MLQGHSGGPLINSAGEVVGWNVRHVTLREATTLPGYLTGSGPHVPVACGINEFRPVRSLVEQLQMWCSKSEVLRRQVFGVPGVPGGMPGPPASAVDIPQHFAAQQHCLHVRMHEAQMAAAALAAANDAADAAAKAGDAATAAKAREKAAAAHATHAARMAKQAEAAAQRVEGGAVQVQAAAAAAEEAEAKAAGHAVAAAGEASKVKAAAQNMGQHFLQYAERDAQYAEHDAQRKRKEADYEAGQADEAEALARQKRQAVLTVSAIAGEPSAGISATAGGSGGLGGAEGIGTATSSSAAQHDGPSTEPQSSVAKRPRPTESRNAAQMLVVFSSPLSHVSQGREIAVPALN